jgi:hypothetical protein
MGTTLRRRRHLRVVAPDDDLLAILRDEAPLEGLSIFVYEDDLEAAWEEHGDAIVREWVRHSPGCRPSLWWRFESPEPRRQLSGAAQDPDTSLAYGIPTTLEDDIVEVPTFETQATYLKRLKLWLPREGAPILEPHQAPPVEWEFWQVYQQRRATDP